MGYKIEASSNGGSRVKKLKDGDELLLGITKKNSIRVSQASLGGTNHNKQVTG